MAHARFGAVGDLHGDFAALERIMSRHPDVPFWLCPGDVASDEGRYPTPAAPLYWIKGNNEDFDFIERETTEPGSIVHLHYIPNAVAVHIGGLTVAGLGGTLAPTWYETPAGQLPRGSLKQTSDRTKIRSVSDGSARGWAPQSRSLKQIDDRTKIRSVSDGNARGWGPAPLIKDDKRRHFVREEVEACRQLRGVDIFLSHEAPRPFIVEPARASAVVRRIDAGKKPINEVLAGMQPRLHLFGHHHRFTESVRENVRSIGLDQVAASYLILQVDGESLEYVRFTKV